MTWHFKSRSIWLHTTWKQFASFLYQFYLTFCKKVFSCYFKSIFSSTSKTYKSFCKDLAISFLALSNTWYECKWRNSKSLENFWLFQYLFVSLYTSPIYRYIYGCETCGRCEIKTFSMVLFSVLVSFLGIVQKLLQVFEAQKI